MFIYADNAATTRVSQRVVDAMLPYFRDTYANPSSLHSAGQAAKNALENSREKIAMLLGARPKEIFFTSGGSESDNQAIVSAAQIGLSQGKRHIISSKIEHHAVLHTLEALEKEGFEIELLSVDEGGAVNPEDVKAAIRPDTALVTIMYVNNEIGTIQPISEIGSICRQQGVLFHTDAVQAVGHVRLDVNELNVDFLSLSAHKFHGPKGIGLLYARSGISLSNIIYGGAQERQKRPGTENVPGVVGMQIALEDALADEEANNKKLIKLQKKLIDGLLKIPNSSLNGSLQNRISSNINISFDCIEGESLLILLDNKGICVSSGSACTSGSLDPSHVLMAIGRTKEEAVGALRITLGEDANEEEVDYLIKTISETVAYLRQFSAH